MPKTRFTYQSNGSDLVGGIGVGGAPAEIATRHAPNAGLAKFSARIK
jgi:hypothetical protein